MQKTSVLIQNLGILSSNEARDLFQNNDMLQFITVWRKIIDCIKYLSLVWKCLAEQHVRMFRVDLIRIRNQAMAGHGSKD